MLRVDALSESAADSRRNTVLRRALTVGAAAVASFTLASAARAQACIGIPADDGRISVKLEATAAESEPSYGGRLAMNFNTPFSLEASVHRPRSDFGRGTRATAAIAYEMLVYEPAMCPVAGFRYETEPVAGGERRWRMVPLGLGIGKRLGSASGLSFSIFARPEYLYMLTSEGPDGDAALGGLADRSEGRGVLGLILGTPFLFATGAVEVSTLDDYEPHFNVGVGMTF